MKSYNNLYVKFLSEENIRLAIKNVCKHKTKRRRFRELKEHPEKYISWIRNEAMHFHNDRHTPMEIYDGITRKKRTIIVPSFREQIIHHMIVNILKPIFEKSFYFHSYGSIPHRGGHLAKKRIERFISKGKNMKYCLKMDIKKYFDSIPHATIKAKLSKIIKDRDFIGILYNVVDVTDVGIPLGFYTSQWFANWYLTGLDFFIKQTLGVKAYWRYMDDMVCMSNSKKFLHKVRKAVDDFLHGLGLKLKENFQVFRFVYKEFALVDEKGKVHIRRYGRDLDFMGFRFFRNRTILRRSIFVKAIQKARAIWKKILSNTKITIFDMRQMLSYLGWFDATDTYRAYEEYVKPVVNFGDYKKHISKHDRRLNYGKVA